MQGLLIVYPLDPNELGVGDKVSTVIGLALSLSFTADVAAKWVVNAGIANA